MIKKCIIQLPLLCSLAMFTNQLYADHPSFGFGSVGGGINTTSAQTLPQGKWAVQLRLEHIENDRFSDNELEDFANAGIEEVHSVDALTSYSIGFAYGLTDKTQLSAYLPFITRDAIREGELELGVAEVHTLGDSSGTGDAVIQLQHQFWSQSEAQASVIVGIKTPNGDTDENKLDGTKHGAEFQPGSDSWDPIIGIAYSRQMGQFGFDSSLHYVLVNEGTQDTDLGDIVDYDISVSYQLNGGEHHQHDTIDTDHTDINWNLILELNGETRQKAEANGVESEHEGGTLVFISPGIKVSTSNGISGYLSAGIPIVENLNGQQSEADYRIITGFSVSY